MERILQDRLRNLSNMVQKGVMGTGEYERCRGLAVAAYEESIMSSGRASEDWMSDRFECLQILSHTGTMDSREMATLRGYVITSYGRALMEESRTPVVDTLDLRDQFQLKILSSSTRKELKEALLTGMNNTGLYSQVGDIVDRLVQKRSAKGQPIDSKTLKKTVLSELNRTSSLTHDVAQSILSVVNNDAREDVTTLRKRRKDECEVVEIIDEDNKVWIKLVHFYSN